MKLQPGPRNRNDEDSPWWKLSSQRPRLPFGAVTEVPAEPAIRITDLSHAYGQHMAISSLSLEIGGGEVFALLGPNGSGKTTLFRVLSTLIRPQQGAVTIFGTELPRQAAVARALMGVVFQAPSVDKKLTVLENLCQHGKLYGLGGTTLRRRADQMMQRLGLTDRRTDLVEKLSGGLRRRVELAQGLLHQPRLLLLDEPSTGLDPGARSDLWRYLQQVREQDGVTVLLTTHLLDEAEKADRIGIMHRGQIVALDSPANLRASVGGDTITIETQQAERLASQIEQATGGAELHVVDGTLRIQQADGHHLVAQIMEQYGDQIQSITLGKPTLEDVFISRTGHRFWDADSEAQG